MLWIGPNTAQWWVMRMAGDAKANDRRMEFEDEFHRALYEAVSSAPLCREAVIDAAEKLMVKACEDLPGIEVVSIQTDRVTRMMTMEVSVPGDLAIYLGFVED
jgi:hypothetical protein